MSLSSRPARAGVAPTAVAGCRAGPKLEALAVSSFQQGEECRFSFAWEKYAIDPKLDTK